MTSLHTSAAASHLLKVMSTCLTKAWNAIDRLSIIWKSDLSNKIGSFPICGRVTSIVWMHYMDANETQSEKVRWELNKNTTYGFEQILEATPPIQQQLYSHLPTISQTIQVRQTRHARHSSRSKVRKSGNSSVRTTWWSQT